MLKNSSLLEIKSFLVNHYELLIPIFLGILVQVPRIAHTRGIDGYQLVLQSTLLINGFSEKWLISPLSFFGIYPFSGYPFLSVFFFSLFYLISFENLDIAVLLFNFSFVVIAVISNKSLLDEFNYDRRSICLGNLLFILLPTFLDYSYFSVSARMPFLALAPLGLKFLIRFYHLKTKITFLKLSFILLILMLLHRMAMIYLLFTILTILIVIIQRASKERIAIKKLTKQDLLTVLFYTQTLILIIVVIFFSSSFVYKIPEPFILDFSLLHPLYEFLNLNLEYFIILGPFFLFALGGILLFYLRGMNNHFTENWTFFTLLLILITPLLFVVKTPHYPRHLLIPLLLPFCIEAWNFLIQQKKEIFVSFLLLILVSSYYFTYHFLIRQITPHLPIIILLPVISIIFVFVNKKMIIFTKKSKKVLLRAKKFPYSSLVILVVIFHSFLFIEIYSNIDIDEEFPLMYTSNEEIYISDQLKEMTKSFDSTDFSFFFASHFIIEKRVAAYSGSLMLLDGHSFSFLVSDYIEPEEVYNNSTLVPITEWGFSPYIFDHPKKNFGIMVWHEILENEYKSDIVQFWLNTLNINFFVNLKGRNNSAYSPWFSNPEIGVSFYSPFIETIEGTIVAESTHLALYKLHFISSRISD